MLVIVRPVVRFLLRISLIVSAFYSSRKLASDVISNFVCYVWLVGWNSVRLISVVRLNSRMLLMMKLKVAYWILVLVCTVI